MNTELIEEIKRDIQDVAYIYPTTFNLYDEPLERLACRLAKRVEAQLELERANFFEELINTKRPSIAATRRAMVWSVLCQIHYTLKRKFKGLNTKADERTIRRRKAICVRCNSIRADGRCAECGCFLKMKTKLVTATCPKELW